MTLTATSASRDTRRRHLSPKLGLAISTSVASIIVATALYNPLRIYGSTGAMPFASARQNIIRVRDFVYRSSVIGTGGDSIDADGDKFYALGTEKGQFLCGGMAASMAWALNQIGQPARLVQLAGMDFIDGRDRYQTHVTVEVLLEGQWHISDPTYNATIDCSNGDRELSVIGVRQCIARGFRLISEPGPTQINGRTIATDERRYEDYFAAYAPIPRQAQVEQIVSFPGRDWVEVAASLYPSTQTAQPTKVVAK